MPKVVKPSTLIQKVLIWFRIVKKLWQYPFKLSLFQPLHLVFTAARILSCLEIHKTFEFNTCKELYTVYDQTVFRRTYRRGKFDTTVPVRYRYQKIVQILRDLY